MSIKVGDTIGDYEVIGTLGTGGMGQVYKVRNTLSNRLEAMKVLLPGSLGSPEAVERFLREIRVQASLDHPNIAALRTAQRIDDQIVMIMELVEGATLHAMLAKGPIPIHSAIGYMSQALLALSYAHGRGVIHRDIKPGNIMLTREGVIKLTDFGIAKMTVDPTLTAAGATLGSIYYMSPEQVRGGSTADARSDLYSLGVTLYEAITGGRPFQGGTDYDVYTAHLTQEPAPPREKNPNIPPELSAIILKAMAKDAAQRYQTADEFRAALQNPGILPQEGTATLPAAATVTTAPPATTTTTRTTTTRASSTMGTLEMAYVLFMDIVAYSQLKMDEQSQRISELVDIVRDTEEYKQASANNNIISLPTGDGMALVFFQNPTAPVQCAVEVSRALKLNPAIKLRMGVHTGPVYRIADINTNRNVAGGGINMAQRVMDCGDAGHILVSKTVAETLGQLSDWASTLHDLGEAEVKHGVKVHIVNFYTEEVGNPELPGKMKKAMDAKAPGAAPAAAPAPVAAAAAAAPAPSYAAAPVTAAPAGGSKKGLIIVGGIAAAIVITFAVTQFMHKGAPESPAGSSTPPGATTPSQPSTPPPPPPSSVPPTAPPPSTPPPASPAPATASQPQATPPATTAKKQPAASQRSADQPATGVAQKPAEAPPSQATAAAAPSGVSAADKALLQEQRERMIMLGGRAAAARSSVENLERQQQRAGLGLRGDMAAAKESMEYLMGESKNALSSGDAAGAKRNLDMAEQQVEKLEKFLGR